MRCSAAQPLGLGNEVNCLTAAHLLGSTSRMRVAHVLAAQVCATSPAGAGSDSGTHRSHIGCCSAHFQQTVAQMCYWRLHWIIQYFRTSGITRYVRTQYFQVLDDGCMLDCLDCLLSLLHSQPV